MAISGTDRHRISLVDKFFNPVEKSISEIELDISRNQVCVPMSKGLNVIIGDNSIGKSLFLHAITNNTKINDGRLKKRVQKIFGEK